MLKKLIIVGAGGYVDTILDSIDYSIYKLIGFIDNDKNKKSHLGYKIIAHNIKDIKDPKQFCYFIAIGNNKIRKQRFDELKDIGLDIISIIDKSAIIGKNSKIGKGCFIGKLSIVTGTTTISDNCLLNAKSLVEHGSYISPHANISTNVTINGDVCIGEGTFVGSSSVVIGQINIGAWSTIGAGAVVIRDVDDNTVVVGVPAKPINSKVMLG